MFHRLVSPVVAAGLALALGACDLLGGTDAARSAKPGAALADPVMARALHDPLMSDPDLARRSQANAAIAFADSGALPVFAATPEAAARARDAARAELLAAGSIPAATAVTPGSGGAALADQAAPAELLAAAGAPGACRAGVREGFGWAARLAAPAAIMPQGMVDEAAGSDAARCRVRVVRYQTAASVDDAVAYHDTLAQRAGFTVQRYAEPEAILAASGKKGETLRVHVRRLDSGMSAVDLVFWINP
ncbi:MAG: hypothetical protein ACJLS3_13455 [Erythrobacter sp.]